MATNAPVADSYGLTDMQVASRTFMWSIKNFSYCINRQGKQIYSPKFWSGSDSDHEWRIDLYPNGNSDLSINNVSVYLHLLNSYQEEIKAQYRFCILNDKGKIGYYGVWTNKTLFSPGDYYGSPTYVSRDYLFKNSETLLPNDTLTIYCEIKASTGFQCSSTETETTYNACPPTSRFNACNDFYLLFQYGKYSDVTLILKSGKKLLAHKCILATRSSVFATLMDQHAANQNNLHMINVNDFEDEIIEEMLRFMYSGNVQSLQLLGSTIMAAAVRYDVKELKDICEQSLIKGLTISNAANLLVTADLHKVEQLKAATIQFIALNAKNIISTPAYLAMSTSHPHLLKEVIDAMVIIILQFSIIVFLFNSYNILQTVHIFDFKIILNEVIMLLLYNLFVIINSLFLIGYCKCCIGTSD